VLFFFAVRTTRGARQRSEPHGNDVLHGNAYFSRNDIIEQSCEIILFGSICCMK
jgi:hypothetical protein